jgi:hypothetical protein
MFLGNIKCPFPPLSITGLNLKLFAPYYILKSGGINHE